MYFITDGKHFIGIDQQGKPTIVNNYDKAKTFNCEHKALNYISNIKSSLRKFNWKVIEKLNGEDKIMYQTDSIHNEYTYVTTKLEKDNFNIIDFFSNTISTISQLSEYVKNMKVKESECDLKILDIRHYIRSDKHKLNCIQIQRIGYYLQSIERQRKGYKTNRLIAELFVKNLDRLENIDYIEKINQIATSQYRPRRLQDDDIERIINQKKLTYRKKLG